MILSKCAQWQSILWKDATHITLSESVCAAHPAHKVDSEQVQQMKQSYKTVSTYLDHPKTDLCQQNIHRSNHYRFLRQPLAAKLKNGAFLILRNTIMTRQLIALVLSIQRTVDVTRFQDLTCSGSKQAKEIWMPSFRSPYCVQWWKVPLATKPVRCWKKNTQRKNAVLGWSLHISCHRDFTPCTQHLLRSAV